MAREILLRLALKNFERARDLAHQVADKAQRTLAATKAAADKAHRATEAAKRTAPTPGAGAAPTAAQPGLGDRFERGLRGINEVRERGGQVAGIVAGGVGVADAAALLRLGGRLAGPAGLALTVIAPFVEELIKWHKEKLDAELQERARAFSAELERERSRADYSRRFVEDPTFAYFQAKQAFEETLAEEARQGKRVEKTTGDLVADFGL